MKRFVWALVLVLILGLRAEAREFDQGLMEQIHLPMTIAELRRILGREDEFDPQTQRYHWEKRDSHGLFERLNAWSSHGHPNLIEVVHIDTATDFWMIDKFDHRCGQGSKSPFQCDP